MPQKVKEVQSFLGFLNFYQCFITNYSDMMIPLTQLTCKNTPWVWTSDCVEAFGLLKTAFTTAPILHHFDPNLPLTANTDASDYAIAGILSMCTNDNDVHPVTFYSCTLLGSELNYNTHNTELLCNETKPHH